MDEQIEQQNISATDGRRGIKHDPTAANRGLESGSRPVPESALDGIESAIEAVGGAWQESEEYAGAVGRTTFDLPTSEDKLITVVLAKEHVARGTLGSQSIVRVKSGVPAQRSEAASGGGGNDRQPTLAR